MPFALIIVAIIAITVGLRGTQGDLYNLLKADFSGPGNFFFWLVSVLVIGALGYIKTIKPVSDALLLLLVLVLFLGKDRGFFTQFNQALASTQNAAPSSTTTQTFGGGSWFPLGGNNNPLAQGAAALNNAFSNGSSDSTPGYAGGNSTTPAIGLTSNGSTNGGTGTTGVDFGGGGTVG